MSPLIDMISIRAGALAEFPALIAAAFVAIAARPVPRERGRARPGPIDAHTMRDIGLEQGTIPWL